MYTRKTKDTYILVWNDEEIDSADTLKEARFLKQEYQLAYHDIVQLKRKRVPLTEA